MRPRKLKTLLICLLALAFLAPIHSMAQTSTPKGVKVLGVRVEGAVTADQGLIIANSGLVIGKEVVGDDIQNAIKRIWTLNLFRNVEIHIERDLPSGSFFVISVEEYPRIAKLEIEGYKKLDEDEVDEAINLYRGQVLRPARLQRSLKALLDIYHEKGYLLAKVETEVTDTDDPMQKELRIIIDEGKKVRVKKIHFTGNDAFKEKVLRKQMDETKQRGFLRSGAFDRTKYENDKALIVQFYKNHGYRDAKILGDSLSYTEDLKRLIININIDEGNQYYFGDVSFDGNTLFNDDELLNQLSFKPGDIYNEEELFINTAEKLGNLYYEKGYIYSRIDPQLIPGVNDTLNVKYQVVEGNQFKVRKISILGNTKTKEKVVRREFVLYPGDTFDVMKLRRSMRELTILNYFGNITPDVQPISDSEVDLMVTLEEKPTDNANVSAGYSQADGMIGSVGFNMPNFLGNGQIFSFSWNFGTIYRSFSVSYTEPWLFDTPTLGGISVYDMFRGGDYYGFDYAVTGGSVRVGRQMRWPDDYTRGDWIYSLERTIYDNFDSGYTSYNIRGYVEGDPRWSSSITEVFTRDSRDNPEFPSRGSVVSYSLQLAGTVLGGDDQYLKHVVSAEWYFPVGEKLVIYSETKAGLIFSLSDVASNIPYLDYFFMGGSGLSFGEPLRGYDEGDVGPQYGGYPVGGESLFKQSIEFRVPLIPNPTVYLLGFIEGGNTWKERSGMDLNDLRRSIGVGVRLYMPFVGLIGLDYGYGFDYYQTDGTREGQWMPHFQFGRTF